MVRVNRLTVAGRLSLLVLVFLVGFAAIGTLSLATLRRIEVNGPIYREIIRNKDVVADVLPPPLYVIESYLLVLQALEAKERADLPRLVERSVRLREQYKERRQHWLAELPKGLLRQQLLETSFTPAQRFFDLSHGKVFPALLAGDLARARQIVHGPLAEAYETHRRAIDDVVETATASAERVERSARSSAAWLVWQLLVTSFLIAALAVALAWQIARGLVSRLQQASIALASTATQIAATTREQQSTMASHSASTTQIAAAVKEISATSRDLLATAEDLSRGASRAADLAQEGRAGLESMDGRMRQLSESTGSISSKLSAIRERASSINLVVTTITKVADQTNLLSVNAAIEAEKAGEYGLGFLVVAREIRRLADQAAVATLDIEEMVRQMHAAVSAGVMEMDKFDDEVRSSVGSVQGASGRIGGVIEQVEELHLRFDSLKEGMRSQALGAEQINEAMTPLAEGAEHTEASLRELNGATDGMRDVVARLRREFSRAEEAL